MSRRQDHDVGDCRAKVLAGSIALARCSMSRTPDMRVHWNVVSAHPYKQLGFSEGGALPPVSDTEKRSIVSVAEGSNSDLAPLQPLNSSEHAGMTQKHAAWKALEK